MYTALMIFINHSSLNFFIPITNAENNCVLLNLSNVIHLPYHNSTLKSIIQKYCIHYKIF